MSAAGEPIRLPIARILRGLGGAAVVTVAVAVCAVALLVIGRGRVFALAQGTSAVTLELSAALALIAAGAVALVRRRPFALIAVAMGCSWAVREWVNPAAASPAIFTLGLLIGMVWIPLTGWLALAYPQGIPQRRRDRAVIWISFLATLGPAVVRATAFDPARTGCLACPANLLLLAHDARIAAAAATSADVFALLACGLLIASLIARFHGASPAERILITPVTAASGAALALNGLGLLASVAGSAAWRLTHETLSPVSFALIGVAIAVSWELVRIAAARSRSARLVADLSAAARPGRLRSELARITHDDSLEVVFPLEDRVVDADGRPTADPRRSGGDRVRRVTVAVGRDGAEVALLTHRPGLLEDLGFRDAVTHAAGLALEHERLQAELASRVRDLRESRARLVDSSDAERRRLERNLHDGAQQQVVALLLELRLAHSRQPNPDLDEAILDVTAALDDLRRLAHGIYPATLGEEGLGAALDELREGAAIPVRLVNVTEGRWPDAVESTAYVVVAETLRGSGLRAADVDVSEAGGMLTVTVSGDRDGPDVSARFAADVAGLVDRVGAVGGDIRIDDSLGSVTVRAELPCGS